MRNLSRGGHGKLCEETCTSRSMIRWRWRRLKRDETQAKRTKSGTYPVSATFDRSSLNFAGKHDDNMDILLPAKSTEISEMSGEFITLLTYVQKSVKVAGRGP
jgi:hypothetical protein